MSSITGHPSVKEPNPFLSGQTAYKRGQNPHKLNPYRKHSREWTRFMGGWQASEALDNRGEVASYGRPNDR